MDIKHDMKVAEYSSRSQRVSEPHLEASGGFQMTSEGLMWFQGSFRVSQGAFQEILRTF